MVKCFIHNDQYYVYDSYVNILLNVSKDHYIEICGLLAEEGDKKEKAHKNAKVLKDLFFLKEKGFFKSDDRISIEHPATKYLDDIMHHCINDLTLQVTKNCNFSCRYCTFATTNNITRTHQNESMSFDVAKRSIDFLYSNCSDSDEINIAFYGGEPLINYKLIKDVVEYSNGLFCTKTVQYRMTTNLSIIDDDIIDFLVANSFNLVISFDGDKIISGKHRRFKESGRNTFNTVISNINRIKKNYPAFFTERMSFLPVVFQDENIDNVYSFYSSIGVDRKRVNPLSVDLNGIDYCHSAINTTLYLQQHELFAQENQDYLFADIFKDRTRRPEIWHHNGACIPGVKRLFISTDGSFYSCEKVPEFDALSLGDVYNGFNLDNIKRLINIGTLTKDECITCWAWRYCNICYAQCISYDNKDITGLVKPCKHQKETALKYLIQRIDAKSE